MGYCIKLEEGQIKLSKENMKKALKELSKHSFIWCDDFYYENIVFEHESKSCWEETDEEEITVEEVWDGLRYEVEYKNCYWIINEFNGEKLGDDEYIFNLIAPYCEDGYLQYLGEDGERWRYVITDRKCETKKLDNKC